MPDLNLSGKFFFPLTLICWFFSPQLVKGQEVEVARDSTVNKKAIVWGASGLGVVYGTSLYILSQTWYQQSEKTSFHFFNDSQEWQQLDKAGHFWGAFHESRIGVDVLRLAGVQEKKAIIYGGLLGLVLQSPIELLDGYAPEYGASVSDLGANAFGSLAVIMQELWWGQLRLQPKFSFHPSGLAVQRPQVLGRNFPEQILKDYNGQTYWLTADVATFLPRTSKYPKWLNLAVGYGGEQMLFGEPITNRQNGFRAYRQYYLALDLNLLPIKTRSKFLRTAFYILSSIHLPAPAVEYNQKQGLKFHPLYF